jgi:hypothetical protein
MVIKIETIVVSSGFTHIVIALEEGHGGIHELGACLFVFGLA